MTDPKTTLQKKVIEIADYIYANPDKGWSYFVEYFGVKWSKPRGTVEKWIIKAHEYNRNRLQAQEKIRNEVIAKETEKAVKKALKSRSDLLEFYASEINEFMKFRNEKDYKVRKIENTIIIPTFQDAVKAGQEISKIEGFYEPIKTEQKIMSSNIVINYVKSDIPLFSSEDEII